MTKVEYTRCKKLMEEAIQKAKQTNEEFNKAKSEKDIVSKSIILAMAHGHLGYAKGINQTLVCIGFKHERMKDLENLLYE